MCGGQSQGGASMCWDLTARRLAPPSPLSLLLVLVLLSGAGALRPEELFPYGESWGDRLPQEGDDESSASEASSTSTLLPCPVQQPLHKFSSQRCAAWCGVVVSSQSVEQLTSMFNCHRRWGPGLAVALQLLDPYCGGKRIISRESWNRPCLLRLHKQKDEVEAASAVCV
ncbi:nidogen-2-like [Rattus norvegicus]|uniref:nidogen-2-like n=1 Tax=Rattus norvegicus TaxID=10116 RepID=UPI002FD80C9C